MNLTYLESAPKVNSFVISIDIKIACFIVLGILSQLTVGLFTVGYDGQLEIRKSGELTGYIILLQLIAVYTMMGISKYPNK